MVSEKLCCADFLQIIPQVIKKIKDFESNFFQKKSNSSHFTIFVKMMTTNGCFSLEK